MAIHLGTLNLEKGRVGEIIVRVFFLSSMAFHQEEVVVIGEKQKCVEVMVDACEKSCERV